MNLLWPLHRAHRATYSFLCYKLVDQRKKQHQIRIKHIGKKKERHIRSHFSLQHLFPKLDFKILMHQNSQLSCMMIQLLKESIHLIIYTLENYLALYLNFQISSLLAIRCVPRVQAIVFFLSMFFSKRKQLRFYRCSFSY